MRKYYNYAIDLGTTNSCIAKFENGKIKVFKNIEGMEVIPSAVYINKKGKFVIGRKAIDKSIVESRDTSTEFKRLMGVKHKYAFDSSGIELTPAELSSEILKSLKEDVYRINGEIVENAVITVPAAFNSLQCESTYEAAKLAGFSNVVLLQEPIAAALAYGVDLEDEEKYMIFDLGGGTLDVAIVSILDGNLKVLNHEGDNFLGGKDIDRVILENIILPEIKKKYAVNLDDSNNRMYEKLVKFSEEAKKAMATTNTYTLDIFDVGVDEDHEEIDIQIIVNSDLVNKAIMPILNRCIQVAEKAVINAGIKTEDIKEVLLVGGSTYLPTLRTEISNYFSAPINTSKNPMTVVARGATLYASRLFVEDEYNRNDISVQIEYDNIVSGSECNIMGKIINSSEIIEINVIRDDRYWESGWKKINENYFDLDLELIDNTPNNFKIILKDSKGKEIIPFYSEFQIISKANIIKSTNPLLPHTLSLEVDEESTTKLIRMIEKNNPIPARKIKKFKTSKAILPGSDNSLAIKLWEGESDNPGLCEWVGNVYISGDDIKYPIPEGVEIEIDIAVDISRRITINVYIEYADVFKSDIKLYNQELLDIDKPLNRIKSEIKKLMDEIETMKFENENNFIIIEKMDKLLAEVHELYILNHELIKIKPLDKDRVMKLLGETKLIREKLEKIKTEVSDTLKDIDIKTGNEEDTDKIHLDKYGSINDKSKYLDLEQSLKISKEENDRKGEKFYEEQMEKIVDNIRVNSIELWYDIFNKYKSLRLIFRNLDEADMWISKGEESKNNNNIKGVQNAIFGLYNMLDKNDIKIVSEQFISPDIMDL